MSPSTLPEQRSIPDTFKKPTFIRIIKPFQVPYWISVLVWFVLGVVLGYLISALTKEHRIPISALTEDGQHLLAVILSGAFGGLLYSLQNGKLQLPHISDNKPLFNSMPYAADSGFSASRNSSLAQIEALSGRSLYLGWIADCLVGIGGAFAVFLLIPNAESLGKDWIGANPFDIKLLAIATIGGYGGRVLLNRAVSNIERQQEDIAKKQVELQDKLVENTKKIDQSENEILNVKEQVKKDARTRRLLNRYLDKSLGLSAEEEEELKQKIGEASAVVRTDIFEQAQEVLYQNRKQQHDSEVDEILVKNTLEVFKALRDTDKEKNNHRYAAHIAYAFMALEQWQEAIKALDAAIKLRDLQNKGDSRRFWVYECNRAICQIKLASSDTGASNSSRVVNQILKDLRTIQDKLNDRNKTLKDIPQLIKSFDDPINEWLAANQLDPETLNPVTNELEL